jgi:hypothetical protein
LFLQIFNFYRKFESNLEILVSGIFINISKSVSTVGRHLLLAASDFFGLPSAPAAASGCFDVAWTPYVSLCGLSGCAIRLEELTAGAFSSFLCSATGLTSPPTKFTTHTEPASNCSRAPPHHIFMFLLGQFASPLAAQRLHASLSPPRPVTAPPEPPSMSAAPSAASPLQPSTLACLWQVTGAPRPL